MQKTGMKLIIESLNLLWLHFIINCINLYLDRLLQKARLRCNNAVVIRDSLRNEESKQTKHDEDNREKREQLVSLFKNFVQIRNKCKVYLQFQSLFYSVWISQSWMNSSTKRRKTWFNYENDTKLVYKNVTTCKISLNGFIEIFVKELLFIVLYLCFLGVSNLSKETKKYACFMKHLTSKVFTAITENHSLFSTSFSLKKKHNESLRLYLKHVDCLT